MSEEHTHDSGAGGPSSDPVCTLHSTEKHSETLADSKSIFVKRAIEVAADKLGRRRSIGAKSQLTQSQPALPASSSTFSRLRHRRSGKEKANGEGSEGDTATQSQILPSSQLTQGSSSVTRRGLHRFSIRARDDDSPFITPRSPSLGPRRPDIGIFRGAGSIRAGTQALIQALQAMPLADYQDDDDYVPQGQIAAETSSDDDDDDKPGSRLASSIHAIYRPLARSRRRLSSSLFPRNRSPLPRVSDQDEPSRPETVLSDEDLEDDFEPASPPASDITGPELGSQELTSSQLQPGVDASVTWSRKRISRSGSMATVKMQRRARLAEKLRDVFQLAGIQEVVAEIPCWLLRSALLQGYLYLTDTHLCFFAHMPSREDQTLKSGYISKKARTKRWVRRWFILKNDVLSWYLSPTDPYFPHGIVDLRYAMTCEPIYEKDIRIRTNQKTIRLSAESVTSRDEWVKAILKVMMRVQNMGDSVKIAIPYSTIIDVEKSSAMDFSETIEIKVVDRSDRVPVDSYFFAYFNDLEAAMKQIRDAVRKHRFSPQDATPTVIDTTFSRSTQSSPPSAIRSQSSPAVEQGTKSPSAFRFPAFFRPLQESVPLGRAATPAERSENEEFTHVHKRGSSSFMAMTASPESLLFSNSQVTRSPESTQDGLPASSTPASSSSHHTYPPSTTPSPTASQLTVSPTRESGFITWSVGVPSWLRMPSIPSRKTLSNALSGIRYGADPTTLFAGNSTEGVSEVVSSNTGSDNRTSGSGEANDFGYFSVLHTPDAAPDLETVRKFRDSFAFDGKESLFGVFPGYLFRLLPVYGRFYVSSGFLCFKSTGPLSTRTKMVLPLKDILSTEMSKAVGIGRLGLVVMVRGHEELFFEFADEGRRAAFVDLLDRQLEDTRHPSHSCDDDEATSGRSDALILEEFGPRKSVESITGNKEGSEGAMSSSLPAVMFNSTSSTFLTFRPTQSLRFTFLTIGSRGDVQPYISLAKGLMKDGHRCRIATHGEFREWIEGQGIEFGYVGGDPAELMRICVENGTFTVAFLREGMLKFRGWVDDLLQTSWEACQDTDVLIESPSAMSGFHIAEALKIPYFRAFTMTWSRTRAYPHAFAVPDHKMGGNYNYMSYVLFDQVFWRATAGQINRWRRNTLGLPSTSLDKMEPHKIPFLYNFSTKVVPRPIDWPEWIHVTGYWFLDDAEVSSKKWAAPPDLIEFLENARKESKKIVYIGFGSIVVSDPKAMTRCVIDAVVRGGVYAILSKGWSDRLVKTNTEASEPEEPLPKQIYPVASIPHDWLFRRVDAACHHGGAGTTGASLRAGIPTIIRPFFGDQFFWGDRVEALGVGTALRKLTVESLTQALIAATTDQKQIERARELGEKIRAEDGVATAIEAIYRDLEYARSLVKGGISDDPQDGDAHGEDATIREYNPSSSPEQQEPVSGRSSPLSSHDPHDTTSDWSVISGSEPE